LNIIVKIKKKNKEIPIKEKFFAPIYCSRAPSLAPGIYCIFFSIIVLQILIVYDKVE
jgi:hypothetical protein